MKTLVLSLVAVLIIAGNVSAQVFGTNCPTLEQQQAAYNRSKAAQIVVRDTASQQLQCYYQQLATYYQQLDKDNQQKAKDLQQIAKDKQQVAKDLQQIETDRLLCEKLQIINDPTQCFDELDEFLCTIIPLIPDSCKEVKDEFKRIHTNRSGQADGTNPGGQTHNINGFDNPAYIRKHL